MKRYTKSTVIVSISTALIILLSSCGDGDENGECIDLGVHTETSIFDVFEYVDAIQLETREDVFLSNIIGIQQAGDKLFVLDFLGVFCFSVDGDFLFQVARQGRGPGEFISAAFISIDKQNNRLLLLDNVAQSVHFFSLEGKHQETIRIDSDTSLGLGQVIPMQDSLLLFRGNRMKDFVLYCLRERAVIEKLGADEKAEYSPSAFFSYGHLYSYANGAYVLPLLQDTVFKATRAGFEPYYSYCFGRHANTPAQISSLVRNYEAWHSSGNLIPLNYFVGASRYLNHFIINVLETNRFVLTKLEFDGDYLNIIADKETGKQHVFNVFQEDVQIPQVYYAQDNELVIPSNFIPPTRESTIEDFAFANEYASYWFSNANRNNTPITRDLLTERGKQVYDNHDPMQDNPYLIVFRFRE